MAKLLVIKIWWIPAAATVCCSGDTRGVLAAAAAAGCFPCRIKFDLDLDLDLVVVTANATAQFVLSAVSAVVLNVDGNVAVAVDDNGSVGDTVATFMGIISRTQQQAGLLQMPRAVPLPTPPPPAALSPAAVAAGVAKCVGKQNLPKRFGCSDIAAAADNDAAAAVAVAAADKGADAVPGVPAPLTLAPPLPDAAAVAVAAVTKYASSTVDL